MAGAAWGPRTLTLLTTGAKCARFAVGKCKRTTARQALKRPRLLTPGLKRDLRVLRVTTDRRDGLCRMGKGGFFFFPRLCTQQPKDPSRTARNADTSRPRSRLAIQRAVENRRPLVANDALGAMHLHVWARTLFY